MKKLIKSILTVATVSLLVLISMSSTTYNRTYSIVVKVDNLRNSKGNVQFSLYNKEGSIPDEKYKKYYKQFNSKITSGSAMVTFKNIPKGKYAINILHDENKNGKIDKGWIMPIEGIGFSNYSSIGLTNRPNFSKASFNVNENIVKHIKVIYM